MPFPIIFIVLNAGNPVIVISPAFSSPSLTITSILSVPFIVIVTIYCVPGDVIDNKELVAALTLLHAPVTPSAAVIDPAFILLLPVAEVKPFELPIVIPITPSPLIAFAAPVLEIAALSRKVPLKA
jgi:hypothetical protein